MITGTNCLKFHCLSAWVRKLRSDGPEPPIDSTEAMRKLAASRHVERIICAEGAIAKMRAAQ